MKAIFVNNQARAMYLFWRVLIGAFQSENHEVVCLVPPGDPDSDAELEKLGARVRHYPLARKSLNPFQDLRSFMALKNIISEEKADLIFASTIKPVIYGCLAAKTLKTARIYAAITGLGYVFETDSPVKRIINFLGRQLYRFALQNISGIFFQNGDDRDLFRQLNLVGQSPVFMAKGTGVDLNKFTPATFPEVDKIKFLLIARLLEAKGLREYAQAAEMLKKKWPNASFQLLGPKEKGPGAVSEQELALWINNGIIEYLGETRDVRPYIANSHVVVLPSWREGLPTSIMEAMAMGRPCVAANSPGCKELVINGKNGFLAIPRDAVSLAEAMQNFLKSPELVSKMGAESRRLAETDLDAETVARAMLLDMTG